MAQQLLWVGEIYIEKACFAWDLNPRQVRELAEDIHHEIDQEFKRVSLVIEAEEGEG